MRHCRKCNQQLAENSVFCMSCGHNQNEAVTVNCAGCNQPLPDTATFCDKCGHKQGGSAQAATKPTAAVPPMQAQKKSGAGKVVAIVAACLLALAIAGGAVWFFAFRGDDDTYVPAMAEVTPTPTPGVAEVPEDAQQGGVVIDGSVISWNNMAIDNPELNLTEAQIAVLRYFDEDYFLIVEYDNLQRYPQVYRNAQIRFDSRVVRVLEADDDTYEALVSMNLHDGFGDRPFDSMYFNSQDHPMNQLILVRGRQPEGARIVAGDELVISGRYVDIESVDIDGSSSQLPVVNVNFTIRFSVLSAYSEPRHTDSDIRRVASAIFGDGFRMREFRWGHDSPDSYWAAMEQVSELYYERHYIVTPDNQAASVFNEFVFNAVHGRIHDWYGLTSGRANEVRLFNVAADFEHYIISLFDTNMNHMYLEYYDLGFNLLWRRRFENVLTVPYDHTNAMIALVADNSLYLIDTQTGENIIDPAFVGASVNVRIMEDGIILIGAGRRDNIMKVDFDGNIMWRSTVDIEIAEIGLGGSPSVLMQIIGGNIVASLRATDFTNRTVVVDMETGNITLEIDTTPPWAGGWGDDDWWDDDGWWE